MILIKNKTLLLVLILIFLIAITYKKYSDKNLYEKIYQQINPKTRIFCFVLTTPKGFKTSKSQTVFNIWVSKCDDYKFITLNHAHNQEKSKLKSKILDSDNLILQPSGLKNDTYNKLSDKVFMTIRDVSIKHNDFDWYLKADDDTYIEMDNLRNFLQDKNPKEPITYGHNFKVIVEGGYHSGGAGYVLSNEALNRLGTQLVKNYSFCKNTGTEDVDIAACSRRLGIRKGLSVDEKGKDRFFPLSLDHMYNGHFPNWLFQYAETGPHKGFECCSDSFISFHYMSSQEMVRLDSVMKSLRSSGRIISYKPTFEEIVTSYYKYLELENKMSENSQK